MTKHIHIIPGCKNIEGYTGSYSPVMPKGGPYMPTYMHRLDKCPQVNYRTTLKNSTVSPMHITLKVGAKH